MAMRVFRSRLGFAIVLSVLLGAVLALFLFSYLRYDRNSSDEFGISDQYAGLMLGAYIPSIVAAFTALRTAVFQSIGPNGRKSRYRLQYEGIIALYVYAILGVATAVFGVLYIALTVPDPEDAKSKWLVGVAGAVWAGTMGEVIRRFFNPEGDAGGDG